MVYTLQKLKGKKVTLLEKSFGCYRIYRNAGLSNSYQKNSKLYYSFAYSLGFQDAFIHSPHSFCLHCNKKKKARNMSSMSDVLYSIVLCIGLTVVVLKVTSAGHAKALAIFYHQHILLVQYRTDQTAASHRQIRKSSLRQKENDSAQKCMVTM